MRQFLIFLLIFLQNARAQKRRERKEKKEENAEISLEVLDDFENADINKVLQSFKNSLTTIISKFNPHI